MKIKCPLCHRKVLDTNNFGKSCEHLNRLHLYESPNYYLQLIFKIHEKREYIKQHSIGNPSYKYENDNYIALLDEILETEK